MTEAIHKINSMRQFRIGQWLVTPAENRIESETNDRVLEPRLMRLLTAMASRGGDVLSKEQLIEFIWDGQHASAEVVSVAIYELRKALGDDARDPRFIKTIRKQGFQWVAEVMPVVEPPTEPVPEPVVTQSVQPVSSKKRGGLPWLIAFALLALTLVVRWLWFSPVGPQNLAVLPFAYLSREEELRYFAAGLTESLINDLARESEVTVLPHHSVQKYADSRKTAGEIGAELGVDAIVGGAVQVVGSRVRVTVQLVSKDDRHLWAKSYEEDIRHFFRLQHQLSNDLSTHFDPEPVNLPLAARAELAPDLYHAYLRGRYLLNRGNIRDIPKAVNYFRLVTRQAPFYGPADAGLAHCYLIYGHWLGLDPSERLAAAKPHLTSALVYQEPIAEAWVLDGVRAFFFEGDAVSAESAFYRAEGLHATSPLLVHWQALFLAATGKMTSANNQLASALQLDPIEPKLNAAKAWLAYFGGEAESALADIDQALAVQGDQPQWQLLRLLCLRRLNAEFNATDREFLEALESIGEKGMLSPLDLAAWYAGEGRPRLAIDQLERALSQPDPFNWTVSRFPEFRSLADQPEFKRILRGANQPGGS